MTPINSVPSCLEDFIGVKCLTANPKSGLWINDLPGINLRYAADIVDSDGSSGLQFLKDKIDYATKLVVQELNAIALPYFRLNGLVDQIEAGVWKNTYQIYPIGYRGVKLKASRGRLLRIRVNRVEFKCSNPSTLISFKIKDGENEETYTGTTDADGYYSFLPEYLSKTNEVYVLVDTDGNNINKTDIKKGCGCSTKTSKFLTATGWDDTTSKTANTTFGLIVDATAECSYDEFACMVISKLSFPILFRAGMEIVKEGVGSDRLNSITLLDTEKADFLLKDFEAEYAKHTKILADSIPELMKRIDDCCIICNMSRYVQAKP
jgi:hypothetical protein